MSRSGARCGVLLLGLCLGSSPAVAGAQEEDRLDCNVLVRTVVQRPAIRRAALSTDGRLLALVRGWNNPLVVEVLERETGRIKYRWRIRAARINALCFRPGKLQLALPAPDPSEVVLWDFARGKQRVLRGGHPQVINCVVFSPDGKLLASGGGLGKVCLWNPETGKLLATFQSNGGGVLAMAFHPRKKLLATAAYGDAIRIWDLNARKLALRLRGIRRPVIGLAFAGQGERLLCLVQGRFRPEPAQPAELVQWDLRLPGIVHRVVHTPDSQGMAQLALHPDGSLLAINTRYHLNIWDLDPLQHRWEIWSRGDRHRPWHLIGFTPDGKRLLTHSLDRVSSWDPHRRPQPVLLKQYQEAIRALAFSPSGEQFVVACGFVPNEGVLLGYSDELYLGGEVELWRRQGDHWRAEPLPLLPVPQTPPRTRICQDTFRFPSAAAFSPDGRLLALGHGEGMLEVRRADSWKLLWSTLAHSRPLDQKSLAVRRRWDRLIVPVAQVAFSPDGKQLASVGAVGHRHQVRWHFRSPVIGPPCPVRIWDAATGRLLAQLQGHTEPLFAVSFSPDGKLVAAAGTRTSALEDPPQGDPVKLSRWIDHSASRCMGVVYLWELETRKLKRMFIHPHRAVSQIVFSPDGRFLLVAASRIYIYGSDSSLEPGGGSPEVVAWNLAQGRARFRIRHPGSVSAVAIRRDGKLLAVGSSYGVQFHSFPEGRLLHRIPDRLPRGYNAMAFSHDGRVLFTAGVRLLQWHLPRRLWPLPEKNQP